MFDLIILFTLFIGLVVILALVNYFQRWKSNPLVGKKLLNEWLEAHKLELPDASSIFSVLNRRLQEIESDDWEKLELTTLLPGTELPVFSLINAELSSDHRDITLCCTVEWPMCLPGVGVTVLEKGMEEPVTCHFMIDWMNAQIRVSFSEKNGVLMLSYENTYPLSMGVACMVADGSPRDAEHVPSMVADSIQQMLMELQLDQVPLVPLYSHTPSLPLVLVSSPEEAPLSSHDQDETTPNGGPSTELVHDLITNTVVTSDPVTTPTIDEVITPITEEEKEPISDDTQAIPTIEIEKSETCSNEEEDPVVRTEQDLIFIGKQFQSVSEVSNNNPTVSTPPTSPGWRRTNSYEKFEEIEIGPTQTDTLGDMKKTKSISSEQLASPTRITSSPIGKALTLSMAGSEAESIYGADDRIPSTLIFEVNDSIKVRHIVALTTTHASKLRRHFSNAKKLHVYNDHSFVATHLKSRAECAVCRGKISKLFGKQGYVCRDCNMVVHKQCHWKVEIHCPSSSVSSMNLIYPENTSISNL